MGTAVAVSPMTWSSERGGPYSDPALHKGAVFPLHIGDAGSTNTLDPHAYIEGCGTHLRLGQLAMQVPGALGLRIPVLSQIECGSVSTRLDWTGALRMSNNFPAGSLFALCRGDFLLLHDLDFCLFYRSIRNNTGLRLQIWQQP